MLTVFARVTVAILFAGAIAGCSAERRTVSARAFTPIPAATLAAMERINSDRNAPILIRAFKKESEIEVWKRARDGHFALMKTYPVCRWSGQLGPKTREGDRQVPEGFYTINATQMNPNSSQWLAFNVGYPNTLERSLGWHGGDIMVHGTCSSRGCFAMTNEQMEEIYAVMREAFNAGQKAVQFQSYPFHMTAENLARFRHDPNLPFWENLKEGNDRFEVTKLEPAVGSCGARYVFGDAGNPSCTSQASDPSTIAAILTKTSADEKKADLLAASGTQAIRMIYADGDQNAAFRTPENAKLLAKWASSGELSRPEALAMISEMPVDQNGKATTPTPIVTGSLAATPSAQGLPLPASSPILLTAPEAATSLFKTLFPTASEEASDTSVTFPTVIPLPPKRS